MGYIGMGSGIGGSCVSTCRLISLLTLFVFASAAGTYSVPEEGDLENIAPLIRDSRIFTIDFGNTTTSLASLSAIGSLVALKAKIAVVVAALWAAASFFTKWVGALSVCRSSVGVPLTHDYHAEHYGGSSISPVYHEAPYSAYGGHAYNHQAGVRPGRANQEEERGVLGELVELTKERAALADVALGAIDHADCRRILLCWASSFFSKSFLTASDSEEGDGDDPNSLPSNADDDDECDSLQLSECPPSRFSVALSALTGSKNPQMFGL